MIPHCLILLLILHNIQGRRPLHSMSISMGYSLLRSHFALVGFFVFLHDRVGIAISGSATSIGGDLGHWRSANTLLLFLV